MRRDHIPLYLAGAKLQVYLPISIAFDGIELEYSDEPDIMTHLMTESLPTAFNPQMLIRAMY